MIQAMTVGHEGSLSTGHANSSADMLRRLETMVLMAGVELPLRAIREQIASAVDVIVHTARLRDGSRKIVNITEVYGIEEDDILVQDVFEFKQTDFVRTGGSSASSSPPASARRSWPSSPRTGSRCHPASSASRPRTRAGRASCARGRAAGRGRPDLGGGRPADGRPGEGRARGRDGLRLGVGPLDPASGYVVRGGDQGAGPPVPREPAGEARGGGQLPRPGRVGELGAQGADPTSTRSTRSGSKDFRATPRSARDADAAPPAPGRVPGLGGVIAQA